MARAYNARIVLVNRRDYPGSEPYSTAELDALKEALALLDTDPAAARQKLALHMHEGARDVYDLLVKLVKEGENGTCA